MHTSSALRVAHDITSCHLPPFFLQTVPSIPRPPADEDAETAAEDDQEPRVGLPVQEEEEGVPAEPGGPAEGGAAGERSSPAGESGAEGATGGEGGEQEDEHWQLRSC